jgi:FG-GAP repeat protein
MKRFLQLLLMTGISCTFASAQLVDMNNLPEGTIRILGDSINGALGSQVKTIGDINGDGLPDFAITAPIADKVYVVYGKRTYPKVVNLSSTLPYGFVIQGKQGSGFGTSIAAPGDVNRDGKADLVIGAPFDGNGGRIYVMKGGFGIQSVSTNLESQFLLIIEGTPGENLGAFLGNGGYINSDASADILIPSPFLARLDLEDNVLLGAAYVIFGKIEYPERIISTLNLDMAYSSTIFDDINPTETNSFAGYATAFESIGDFTKDGVDDIALVTGIETDPASISIAIIPSAAFMPGIQLANQLSTETIELTLRLFENADMHKVSSIYGCDVNGDGFSELVCGFPRGSLSSVQSATGTVAIISMPEGDSYQLEITPDNLGSTTLITSAFDNSELGQTIACSKHGLLLGAPFAVSPFDDGSATGALHLVSHDQINIPAVVDDITQIASPIFYGREAGDMFAFSIDVLGDLNKDGDDEILILASESGDTPTAVYIVTSDPVVTAIRDFMLY